MSFIKKNLFLIGLSLMLLLSIFYTWGVIVLDGGRKIQAVGHGTDAHTREIEIIYKDEKIVGIVKKVTDPEDFFSLNFMETEHKALQTMEGRPGFPKILETYSGSDGNVTKLVLEFVDGAPLPEALAKGLITDLEAERLLWGLFEEMSVKGLINLDANPDNYFVRDGKLYLIDLDMVHPQIDAPNSTPQKIFQATIQSAREKARGLVQIILGSKRGGFITLDWTNASKQQCAPPPTPTAGQTESQITRSLNVLRNRFPTVFKVYKFSGSTLKVLLKVAVVVGVVDTGLDIIVDTSNEKLQRDMALLTNICLAENKNNNNKMNFCDQCMITAMNCLSNVAQQTASDDFGYIAYWLVFKTTACLQGKPGLNACQSSYGPHYDTIIKTLRQCPESIDFLIANYGQEHINKFLKEDMCATLTIDGGTTSPESDKQTEDIARLLDKLEKALVVLEKEKIKIENCQHNNSTNNNIQTNIQCVLVADKKIKALEKEIKSIIHELSGRYGVMF